MSKKTTHAAAPSEAVPQREGEEILETAVDAQVQPAAAAQAGAEVRPAEVGPVAADTADLEPADLGPVAADAADLEPADLEPMEQGLMPEGSITEAPSEDEQAQTEVRSLIEAIVYVTDEPLSAQQIATAMERPLALVQKVLDQLVDEYEQPGRGLTIRELAGGYKMGTKPEHHEALRSFVKSLKPNLKLSLAALETLAVIAYKQPITGPEIMEIRGVQGAGVLKTLLDRKLIASGGRKNVVGKPMLYKTTREFLLQFGLSGLAELPTLKEFEELKRLALNDEEVLGGQPEASTPEQDEAAALEALAATKEGVPEDAAAQVEPAAPSQPDDPAAQPGEPADIAEEEAPDHA